jgi:hypothetical protein
VLPIPVLGAVGVLLKQGDVIEAFLRHVALVFDDRAVGSFEVSEASAVGGLKAWALASAISALVRPRDPFAPGQVPLLAKTMPSSSVV